MSIEILKLAGPGKSSYSIFKNRIEFEYKIDDKPSKGRLFLDKVPSLRHVEKGRLELGDLSNGKYIVIDDDGKIDVITTKLQLVYHKNFQDAKPELEKLFNKVEKEGKTYHYHSGGA